MTLTFLHLNLELVLTAEPKVQEVVFDHLLPPNVLHISDLQPSNKSPQAEHSHETATIGNVTAYKEHSQVKYEHIYTLSARGSLESRVRPDPTPTLKLGSDCLILA